MARPDVMVPRELALCLLLSLVLFSTIGQTVTWSNQLPRLPEFLAPLENHTITQGRDVCFTCVVNHLQEFRVAWIKSDSRVILAINTQKVSPNSRLSVTHNGHNTWKLHVVNVQPEDSGAYMCQVNTDPMRSLVGYLKVQIPPDIMDDSSSGSPLDQLTCHEGGSVRLRCQATGSPSPEVTWKREDGKDIVIRREKEIQKVKLYKNEYLELARVLRQDMGTYLCIATNGVPPAVSKRYYVNVDFEPTVRAKSRMVYAHVNGDATLECHVESWPKSLTTWFSSHGVKVGPGERYTITETRNISTAYIRINTLKIRKIRKLDFGNYTCYTESPMGNSSVVIHLKEKHKVITTSTPRGRFSHKNVPEKNNAVPGPEKVSRPIKEEGISVEDTANRSDEDYGSVNHTELHYLSKATMSNSETTIAGCLVSLIFVLR